MNIVVIGSGISAIIVAKTFLEYNYKVSLVDTDHYQNKEAVEHKKKKFMLHDIKMSPKFNNKNLVISIKKFKKKYNISTKNFFLASGLISGGLSNFWGGGLQIPDTKYFDKYYFSKSLIKEQKYINKELKIEKEKYNFFNFFFKQKIIKKFLKKSNKTIYFSKFLLALTQYNKKKLTINDYDNIDLLSGNNRYLYNSKFQISTLLQNKNFTYIPNTFIKNVKKKGKLYELVSENKKIQSIKFNKLIISSGTVGSTILVDRILKSFNKYRLFHTPILKLMYFSFLLPFKLNNQVKFGLPLLNLNIENNNDKFSGSFMYLNNISNHFFGIKKLNILFSFIKKFIFVGNIFLPSNYSNTVIDIKRNKTLIYSKNNFNKKKLILMLRRKLNNFLLRLGLFEFFPQNLKFLKNGSDAHYTSTLENKYINGKKLLNNYCELNNFKNIHIIDGSSIKIGLHFPTYFLMLHARCISKKIIADEKKNKN
jgi:hypothetical protein